jgi:hypothetical protein
MRKPRKKITISVWASKTKTDLAEQELSELSDKIKKVDELKDTLEKRLEAAHILEEESVDFGKQQNELAGKAS